MQLQCSVFNALLERDVVLTKGNQRVRSLNGSEIKELRFLGLKKKKINLKLQGYIGVIFPFVKGT